MPQPLIKGGALDRHNRGTPLQLVHRPRYDQFETALFGFHLREWRKNADNKSLLLIYFQYQPTSLFFGINGFINTQIDQRNIVENATLERQINSVQHHAHLRLDFGKPRRIALALKSKIRVRYAFR